MPALSGPTATFFIAESTKDLAEEAVLVIETNAAQFEIASGRTATDDVDQTQRNQCFADVRDCRRVLPISCSGNTIGTRFEGPFISHSTKYFLPQSHDKIHWHMRTPSRSAVVVIGPNVTILGNFALLSSSTARFSVTGPRPIKFLTLTLKRVGKVSMDLRRLRALRRLISYSPDYGTAKKSMHAGSIINEELIALI